MPQDDQPFVYWSIDDWLGEPENYATRRERVPEGAIEWIETAWRLATEAERKRCADIVSAMQIKYASDACGWALDEITMTTCEDAAR
jgi:hypothetical protein